MMDGYEALNDSKLAKTKEEKPMGKHNDCICQQAAQESEIVAFACALILLAVVGYQTRQDPDRVIADFVAVLTEFSNNHYKARN